MTPGDISDVPTLSCLNKSQKRALILRDQLRYLEPAHLDTFLDGITADEPPTYKTVNGMVCPPLAQIRIKEHATRFDLGNVLFPEEGGKTSRVYLTVEDGRFEVRTEDALPKDDADLASVAIHRFVAENMFPLFQTKYKAIHARMEKINEARRVAYNMLDHPPAKFEDGETVARLHLAKPKAVDDSSRDSTSRKRRTILKHASNKRQRIGLETIPDTVKSETFNALPAQIKVDLFNTIVKTAFPNFDNLILASWNVVSVYANVGSDFPELHRAVVELKGVLEEFEGAFVPPRTKTGRRGKDATSGQIGSGSRTATPVRTMGRESRGASVQDGRSKTIATNQQDEDNKADHKHDHDTDDDEEDNDVSQHQRPIPRVAQTRQPDEPTVAPKQLPTTQAPSTPHSPHLTHSVPRLTPFTVEPAARNTPSTLPATSPAPFSPRSSTNTLRASTSAPPAPPGSELLRKRQQYADSILKASRGAAQNAQGQTTPSPQTDMYADDDKETQSVNYTQEGEGMMMPGGGCGLGSGSGSGSTGKGVPVAPMLHVRKGREGQGRSS